MKLIALSLLILVSLLFTGCPGPREQVVLSQPRPRQHLDETQAKYVLTELEHRAVMQECRLSTLEGKLGIIEARSIQMPRARQIRQEYIENPNIGSSNPDE
jgi:hypothetical protein